MLRVTEFAFGLEKKWIHHHKDAQCIPWYLCLIAMMAGIWVGDGLFVGALSSLFLMISQLFVILALMLSKKATTGEGLWHYSNVIWMILWIMLWVNFGLWLVQPAKVHLMPENIECGIRGRIEKIEPGLSRVTSTIQSWQCGNDIHLGKISVTMMMTEEELDPERSEITLGTEFWTTGTFEHIQSPDVPGMFDKRERAQIQGIYGEIKRKKNDREFQPLEIVTKDVKLSGRIERSRRKTYQKLLGVSPEGILPALVLGTPRGIPQETRANFSHLGIAHILAVSGLHFGIVAILIHTIIKLLVGRMPWVMRRWGKNRAATAASFPALVLYLVFVGAPISAQRALIMAAICCLARLFSTRPDTIRSLAVAGLIILTIHPMSLFDVGFQLSFTAVYGIILGMKFYEEEIRMRIMEKDLPKKLEVICSSFVSMIIMTISTSLTTAPVVIHYFGQLPLLGIVTNLVVIPYVSFILMPAAILAAIFVMTGLPGTEYIIWLACKAEILLTQFADVSAENIPLAYLDISPHPIYCAAAIFLAAALLYHFKLNIRRISIATIAGILMIACLIQSQVNPSFFNQNHDLNISFIAMGQADATLIEFPDGRTMLIDAGSEIGRTDNAIPKRLTTYLKTMGIRHIDTLVITHSDYDHTGAIPELLKACTIGQIWHNGLEADDLPWKQLTVGIPQSDIRNVQFSTVPNQPEITILWPNPESKTILMDEDSLNPNESSIVLELRYGDFKGIFAGDAGIPVETQLLSKVPDHVTLLKVGHHGSKSASSEAWINRLSPKLAVFSAGTHNMYKFPHLAVQERLQKVSSRMYQTGTDGTIRMRTNGRQIFVETVH